jgi:hypothetical protein
VASSGRAAAPSRAPFPAAHDPGVASMAELVTRRPADR